MYNNNVLSKAILITFAGFGIEIEDAEPVAGSEAILCYFSVPKSSTHLDANGKEMSGKHLASRFKHTLEEMGIEFADCQYRIRDEHWTEKDRERAAKVMRDGLFNF